MIFDSAIKPLADLFSRANLSNPAVPLTGLNLETYTDKRNRAGVSINKESTLSVPAVFNAVKLISEAIAKLPLVVYKRDRDGGKSRAKNHPTYQLLRKRPNENTTAFTFWRAIVHDALLHGNGYAAIMRDNASNVRALHWLDPEVTYPVSVKQLSSTGGTVRETIIYVTTIDGVQYKRQSRDVFHLKGLGAGTLAGYPIMRLLADPIGLSIATQGYAATFYANDATPRYVIQLPFQLKDEKAIARFRESFGSIHRGMENAHKPAILENGGDIKPLSFSAEDAQMVESRKLNVHDVANIIGIPANLLNADIATSYNSLEAQNKTFLNFSLGGWLCSIAQESEAKLLSQQQKQSDSHIIEHVRDELERADRKTEAEVAAINVNNGLVSLDESRARSNLPAVEGGGDKHRMPANIIFMDSTPEPEPVPVMEAEPEPEVDGERSDLLRSATVHLIAKSINRLSIKANKAASKPGSFTKTIDAIQCDDERQMFADNIRPAVGARADDIASSYIDAWYDDLIEASGVQPGQLAEAVSQVMRSHVLEYPEKLTNGN